MMIYALPSPCGSIVALPAHGDIPWDSHATDPGGRHQRKGTADICCVLPMGVEVCGMSSGQVPSEGAQPCKTQGKLHVLALEVEDFDPMGITGATPMLQPLWDSHADGAAGVLQDYRHM